MWEERHVQEQVLYIGLAPSPVVIRKASSDAETPQPNIRPREPKLEISIRSLEPRGREGRKICRRQRGWGHQENVTHRNQLCRVHSGSQRLKWQPRSLHGSVLGPLQMLRLPAWC